jgi:protein O-GlcNAc transferase
MANSDELKCALRFYQAGMLDRADALCKAMIDAKPDDFEALDLLAMVQCRRGRWRDALASYNKVLAISPRDAVALGNRGNVLHQLQRPEDALASYDQALTIRPDYAEMRYGRGNALCALRRYEEAIASYERALAVKPDFAEALNNRGLALRSLQRLQEALESYDRALALRPNFADALCNRGNILRDLRRHQQALVNYDQALAIKPELAGAWYGRGNALRDLKQDQEALASYDRALAISPNFAEALNNRGLALQDVKRFPAALASYDRALAIKPRYAEAWVNRGNTLQQLDRHQDAMASYDAALTVNPKDPEALYNRGITLQRLRRLEEALESYDRALALAPDFGAAWVNRGNALHDLDRHEQAVTSYNEALRLAPDNAEALYNRGVALQGLRRFEAALASYDGALVIRPNWAEVLSNRGNVLQELQRYQEGLASCDRALALRPDFAEAFNNRGMMLLNLGHYEMAIRDFQQALRINPHLKYLKGLLVHSKMQCCDWRSFADDWRQLAADVQAGTGVTGPFALLGLTAAARDQLLCSRTWVREKCPGPTTPIFRGEQYAHDKIRIGYLSGDFREHPMAYLMAGVFERHDRSRFETLAFSFGPDEQSLMRSRLKEAFSQFIDVRHATDRQIAQQLRDREVDIAVDLMGFTRDARTAVLALRPAPVQVNYLGYPATMGADYIDYIIADRFVIPPQSQGCYSEKVVYLPDTFQATDGVRSGQQVKPTRAAAGLPASGFVFCSFNASHKITPDLFDVWIGLLKALEGSVLWLLGSNPAVERNLRHEAERRGLTPSRLIFAPRVSRPQYLARYQLADLFLDTFPFNAGATASDALAAGLPLVTLCGEAFAARMAGSLLNAVGLPQLATHSLEDYQALALCLAREPAALAELRTTLAHNRATCPLFDTDRSCRALEAAYVTMWQRTQRAQPAESFAVEPMRSSGSTETARWPRARSFLG